MKRKLTNFVVLIVLLGGFVFLYSCNDENDDPKAPPTITAAPTSIEGREGQTVTITVDWTAEAGAASVAASSANATTAAVSGNNGTFNSIYTFGSAAETVTFTITDNDGNSSTSNGVSALVTENPKPSVSVQIDGDPVDDGAQANLPYNQNIQLDLILSAADGLNAVTVAAVGGDAGTLETDFEVGAQNGTATYEYGSVDKSLIGTEVTHTFTVTDQEDDAASFVVKTIIARGSLVVTDANFVAGQTYELTKDIEYMMDGLVYAEKGSKINIEEGTVIKFKKAPTTGDPASALIITRGAQIFAEGTATEPIIFTAELDNVGSSANLLPSDNGQWGGLVILGSAPVMKSGNTLLQIEGISTNEPRGRYGWGDSEFPTAKADDNSGILRYVSIRYTGFALNGQAGDEIQGLTLGAVGSGTTIDYVESYSSDDDGIEIFGGTVDLKHFVVAYASDDSYDLDQGWRGQGQFLLAIQGDGQVSKYDHAGEWDGAGNANDDPFTAPNLANCTFIGPGATPIDTLHDRSILWREGFAGKVLNSIITDMPLDGLSITDDFGGGGSAVSSCETITTARDGYMTELWNTTFANVNNYDGSDIASIVAGDCDTETVTMLNANMVKAQSSKVLENTDSRATGIDPRPISTFPGTVKDPTELGLTGFDAVNYQGAFEAGQDLWLKGWSTLSIYGHTVQ